MEPPSSVQYEKLWRKIIKEPRVTKFMIKWKEDEENNMNLANIAQQEGGY